MAWLDCFKLGVAGSEIEFASNPSELVAEDIELKEEDRNLAGDKKICFVKISTKVTLKYPLCLQSEHDKLVSIKNNYSTFKRLLVNDAFTIIDEVRTSVSKTSVALVPSSRAGITITGVWLATDTAHTDTNYYTGGSFDSSTKTVTLGTQLAAINTPVIIDYVYQGWDMDIMSLQAMTSAERPSTYDITMELEGV